MAVQVAGVEKPVTVKSAVSGGTSVAVASTVVTEPPPVQERETVTAVELSSEKSLATVKGAVFKVLVMVQVPTLRRAEQVPEEE